MKDSMIRLPITLVLLLAILGSSVPGSAMQAQEQPPPTPCAQLDRPHLTLKEEQSILRVARQTLEAYSRQHPGFPLLEAVSAWGKDDWAVVECGPVLEENTPGGTEGFLVMARRVTGTWQIALPGTIEYEAWLSAVPDSALPAQLKEQFRNANFLHPESIPDSDGIYRLPYADGASVYVTRDSDTHGGAIDFWSANGTIVAAADGIVENFEDSHWECCCGCAACNNWIDIRHDNGEKTIYHHIAQHSARERVVRNQRVTAGTPIAIQSDVGNTCGIGRPPTGCNGYLPNDRQCAVHLHFAVLSANEQIRKPRICNDQGSWYYPRAGQYYTARACSVVDQLPHIVFDRANTVPITTQSQKVYGNTPNWTFSGTASDDYGVDHIDFSCWGNNCNETQPANGKTSWSYTRNGLYGHNRIRFRAYDTAGQHNPDSDKWFIDLYVDTKPPKTSRNLSGTRGKNGWYQSAVKVTLKAQDYGSGRKGKTRGIKNRYVSGIETIYHKKDDDKNWTMYHGPRKTITVDGDGEHKVRYRAEDRRNNSESPKSVTFKIDATPPSAPGAATETHGVTSGQWQRDINDPAFTWGAASDATSGVWHYRVNWNDTLRLTTDPAFDPRAVRTGSYELRVQAVDKAGNVGPEGALFTFKYDGTPPHAPDIQNNAGVASGVWQNQVRTPNFSWPTPHDEGSGVQGYYLYWGLDENGTSDTLTTANVFSSATPICAADSAETYYLRLRSEDGVGLQSDWVGYTFHYDGAPPTADLVANYGQEIVHQTSVHLDIAAFDLGSGVKKMRLSTEGHNWKDWVDFSEETYWEIPSVGRRSYDIYLQVLDGAGNLSEIVSDTVTFDVNAPYPRSESFHLWDNMLMAGGGVVTSTNFHMCTALGQSLDSPRSASAQYILDSGFLAGAWAEPTTVPTYTSYTQIGSLVASGGTSATALSSVSYSMHGSLGQPSHMQTVSSTHYVATLGYWGVVSDKGLITDTDIITKVLECEFYSISINEAALFTNSPLVTLNLCGPDAVDVMLSNDGGFGGATWRPYTQTIRWTLTTYGDYVLPRYVYARYRDSGGNIHGTFFDDIIYDPNAPEGEIAFDPADLLPAAARLQMGPQPLRVIQTDSTELFVSVADDSSGMADMQMSLNPGFEGATWEPYSAIVPVTFDEDGVQTVYVRFRDNAGNVSVAASDSLIVDTTPPTGTVDILEDVVGSDVISVTLVFSATDATGAVDEVRVSPLESFTDTIWVTYTQQLPVYVEYSGELTPTLYVQFRDAAGNESPVYTTTYQVDITPPFGSVEVIDLDGTEATLRFTAEDDLSVVTEIWLSPDFWFFEDVSVVEYQETLAWDFEENDEVYVMFVDAVDNFSYPYWAPMEVTLTRRVFLPVVLRGFEGSVVRDH